MKSDKYMGMDVHQAMTVVVVLDADGKVVMETMVPTEAAAIIRLVQTCQNMTDSLSRESIAVLDPASNAESLQASW